MRLIILCCVLVQVNSIYSSSASSLGWLIDCASGDGVRIDSANRILERIPFQKNVSNLRLSSNDSKHVLGDIQYTCNNGQSLTLTFQSDLETHKISQQDDETLEFTVSICRYCIFANISYHLPQDSISRTPYELILNTETYSDIKLNDPHITVEVTYKARYRRPLDNSEYVHSRQITVQTQEKFLRYKFDDEEKVCYPILHLTAFHEGYELLNKEVTSPQSIRYRLCSAGDIDPSNILRLTNTQATALIIEEWLRPYTKVPIKLSRRIELPIITETSYDHDDINLRSTKLSRFFVQYQSNKLMFSQTSETIEYSPQFAKIDLSKPLKYRRPGGSVYVTSPISFMDDDGDNGFELL